MMNQIASFLCAALLCAGAPLSRGADDPLVPPLLNPLLLKITGGMTVEEVRKILATAYPKIQRADGPWSGRGGSLGFQLNERYSVMFAAHLDAHDQVLVSSDPEISIFDGVREVRFDIRRFDWGKASGHKASAK